MPEKVCVLVAEVDGVELEWHEERLLEAPIVDFDNTEFTSDNVADAIVEARDTAQGFTEFEAFGSATQQNTTSNGWVTKSGYPYTTTPKTAGQYILDYTAQVGQSDKEKQVGFRVQYRLGTSGTWLTIADIRDAVSTDDAFQFRTSFELITLPSDGVFQVRLQWGQTDDGGTGYIKNANIKVSRVL